MLSFLDIRFTDIIDILLGAYLMYVIYKLIRGTVAVNIIISIFGIVAFWLLVRTLKMSMMTAIMDNFINIGLVALIVIFQQEIRRFLVYLGTRYDFMRKMNLDRSLVSSEEKMAFVSTLVKSCESMSKTKTGALIIIQRQVGLKEFIATGTEINADYSEGLIETIFFKNTPLHDGAMIVNKHKILAAACILPVSANQDINKQFGLRHRSALGITEVSDAIAIVVSEETGSIHIFENGIYVHFDSSLQLTEYLDKI